jgi:hypothetical protein
MLEAIISSRYEQLNTQNADSTADLACIEL